MSAWASRAFDDEDRAARRTLWFLACSAGTVVVGLVTVLAVSQAKDRHSDALTPSASASASTSGGVGTAPRAVGPGPGVEVSAYTADRRAALSAALSGADAAGHSAGGTRLAVVSVDEYLSEVEARRLVSPARVEALLAAAPADGPAVVDGGVSRWVSSRRQSAQDELTEFARLIPTVSDAGFRAEFEAEVVRLQKVLEGIRPSSPLVFAVVVRAPLGALGDLAARDGIRLVDIADADADPESYRGLRPEETARAGDPSVRPAA